MANPQSLAPASETRPIIRFCPCNWGTRKASGYCSQSERLLFGRDTKLSALFQKICREEPGKQNPRSCRAQELSRSSAQEMSGRKRAAC